MLRGNNWLWLKVLIWYLIHRLWLQSLTTSTTDYRTISTDINTRADSHKHFMYFGAHTLFSVPPTFNFLYPFNSATTHMFCLNIHFSHNSHTSRCWQTDQLVFTLHSPITLDVHCLTPWFATLQLLEVSKDTLRRILQQPGKVKVIPTDNCQLTPTWTLFSLVFNCSLPLFLVMWMCFINIRSRCQLSVLIGHITLSVSKFHHCWNFCKNEPFFFSS